MIPKPGGKRRRLGIPTVRDRVVQAALKTVLEPIFEADFQPCSYGFRPGRRAHDAIAEIHHLSSRSYEWVLEGDITACFDEIDHTALMDRVRTRVKDKRVVGLVKAFLKAGILSEDGIERDIHMRATGQGVIVNVTSLAGVRPTGSSIPYAVSKAAVNHLTVLLANALGPEIRVHTVAPGLIDTPWTADWDAIRDEVRGTAPLSRSGTPEDVAEACVALVGLTYSTGQVLVVDGGIGLRR